MSIVKTVKHEASFYRRSCPEQFSILGHWSNTTQHYYHYSILNIVLLYEIWNTE